MGSLAGAIAGAQGAVRLLTRRPCSRFISHPAADLFLARRVPVGHGSPWRGIVSTPMLHVVGRHFLASSATEAGTSKRAGQARLRGPEPVRVYDAPARPFVKKDIDDLLQRAKSLKLYCSGPKDNVTPEEDAQLLRAVCFELGVVVSFSGHTH